MTWEEVLAEGTSVLEQAQVPEAKLSAWYLFSHCFGMDRAQYFLNGDKPVEKAMLSVYRDMVRKRAHRIPLEYIIRETEFMGLSFYVDPHVLIPRQDTECLVEEVMRISTGKDVLDMCTGSGCIGISLAALGECGSVTLSDVSSEVLDIARENAKRNKVEVDIKQSDLFASIEDRYDIIVSNPPYIPSGEIDELMPEVKDHEPHLALDGREDGLYFYSCIITESRRFLRQGGWLFFEIGCDQGEAVKRMMIEHGYTHVTINKDLADLDRIVSGCQDGGQYV